MPSREQGQHRITAVTSALVAASLAGSLAVAGVAYSTTTGSEGATPSDEATTGETPGDAVGGGTETTGGPGSQLSPGLDLSDDVPHASSGGS
jgi:hypothetical protein